MAQANINQNANGVWNGSNVTVQSNDSSVDFKNHANVSVNITFTNSATFGVSSTTANPGDNTLTIANRVSTDYNLPGSPRPEAGPYSITVDIPDPKGEKKY